MDAPKNKRYQSKTTAIQYLKEILSGECDFRTRTLTFSPTESMSVMEGIRARVISETCSNPLKVPNRLILKVGLCT